MVNNCKEETSVEKKCRKQLSKNTKCNANVFRRFRHTRLRPPHKERWGEHRLFLPNRARRNRQRHVKNCQDEAASCTEALSALGTSEGTAERDVKIKHTSS